MKKLIVLLLIIPLLSNAQLESEVLKQKIEIDTKVNISKNYLIVSTIVTTVGLVSSTDNDNINVLGLGAAIAGLFTTPYHLTRHFIYVHKRNKFYKKHNIPIKKFKDLTP